MHHASHMPHRQRRVPVHTHESRYTVSHVEAYAWDVTGEAVGICLDGQYDVLNLVLAGRVHLEDLGRIRCVHPVHHTKLHEIAHCCSLFPGLRYLAEPFAADPRYFFHDALRVLLHDFHCLESKPIDYSFGHSWPKASDYPTAEILLHRLNTRGPHLLCMHTMELISILGMLLPVAGYPKRLPLQHLSPHQLSGDHCTFIATSFAV
mmetsp:Transcript_11245/g.18364  ORF Transcript_11245/g.18364 Transcript_11245/m.18364 type:complete len:206 (+) Transcript_11245:2526-3143(+)